MILKTYADDYFTYNDGITFLWRLSKTEKPCKIFWEIQGLYINDIYWNVSPIKEWNITIYKLWNKDIKYTLKTYWWTNSEDAKVNDVPNQLLQKINWKNYSPQIWDYLIAKVNPENNYIIELFPTEWKSVNNMLDDMKSLNIPYCTRKQLIQNNDKPRIDYFNNNLYIWFLIWIVLFLVIVLLYKKFKKSKK
jgi:hypothetical protein